MNMNNNNRPIYIIAADIRKDWSKPYFGAVPYINALLTLNSLKDYYGLDSAHTIIIYFLSNATSWRGDIARKIKLELKQIIK